MQIKSKKFLLPCLLLALLGCTSVPVSTSDTLQRTFWILHDIDGQAVLLDHDISLDFSSTKLSGYGGCNRYQGTYAIKSSNEIEVSFILSTKRACRDLERSKNEARLIARLETARTYDIDKDTLIIKSDIGSLGLLRSSVQ